MFKKLFLYANFLSLALVASSKCMETPLAELQSQLAYYQEEARKGNARAKEEVNYLLSEIGRLYPQALQQRRQRQQPGRQTTALPPIKPGDDAIMKEAYSGKYADGRNIPAQELQKRLTYYRNSIKGKVTSKIPANFEERVTNFIQQRSTRTTQRPLSTGPQIAPVPLQPLPTVPSDDVEELARGAAGLLERVLDVGDERVNTILLEVAAKY